MSNLILDTGPLVALLNEDEDQHQSCVEFFKSFRGILLSTEAVLTESLYLLSDRLSHQKKCMEMVLSVVQMIPASHKSLERSLSLMEKYQDIPMDFADATLVALAEEVELGDIFTLDRRGFETYRWGRSRSFTIYPGY